METKTRIQGRISRLLLKRPFVGSLALRLPLIEDNKCQTAYTDGKVLGYNRHFVDSLTDYELDFLIMHEVFHVVLKHPFRRETRDPQNWNIAGDHVINLLLLDDGMTMPEGGLADSQYAGWSTEKVYAAVNTVIDQPGEQSDVNPGDGDQQGDQPGDQQDDQPGDSEGDSPSSSQDASDSGDDSQGTPTSGEPGEFGPDDVPTFAEAIASGAMGEVRDCPASEDGTPDYGTEMDWEAAITVAAAQEKNRGTMPGSWKAAIDQRNAAYIDWTEALQNFLTDAGNNIATTWARPNRRFIDGGDYFPNIKREGIEHLVIAVDTSGSVSDKELRQYLSETMEIVEMFNPKITFMPCDARLGKVQTFEPGEYPDEIEGWEIGGRGGTSFDPPFKYVENVMDDEPTALIYFTDGECYYPDEPEYPVLWCISHMAGEPAPWGESIEVML